MGTRERIRRLKSSAAAKKMISPAWRWSRSSVAPNSSAKVVFASEYGAIRRFAGRLYGSPQPMSRLIPTMDRKLRNPPITVCDLVTEHAATEERTSRYRPNCGRPNPKRLPQKLRTI